MTATAPGTRADPGRNRDMRAELRINRNAGFKARRIMRADDDGNDVEVLRIEGYASVTDQPYEMGFGSRSFMESVAAGAFEKTLAADPKVVLRANHIDLPLASTTGGTLELKEDDTGLWFGADMDGRRSDAQDLFLGIERGDIDETSFAGWIVGYTVDRDTDDWTLNEIDLDRGDVAVVSFGANPFGTVGVARGLQPEAARANDRKQAERRAAVGSAIGEIGAAALPD